jgi:fumarate hydratase subunit beta
MMTTYHLIAPLTGEDVSKLRIGDLVYVSGKAFTCRSMLHRFVFDERHSLPASVRDMNLLIHVGPIVIPESSARWKLVSFMPTSSIRFEKWGPLSVEKWGLRMIIGKTTMGKRSMEMMKLKKCVHCTPRGVTPNLFIDHINITGVDYYDELGSIEAVWQLDLDDLGPFIVDIDCEGNNLFGEIDKAIRENQKDAYRIAGIPDDFEFTKLY